MTNPPPAFPPQQPVSTAPPSGPPPQPPRNSLTGLWIALGVIGGVLVLGFVTLVILVVVAFTTARHWTKVDRPAQPETFHSEQYQTGDYDVSDDRVSPCSVGQRWTDCTNAMVDQYNGACAGVPLTTAADAVCSGYLAEIDSMKSKDYATVSSVGDYGRLTRTPETATRQVSNHDAVPAKTHRATCYLGFIGECRGMPVRPGGTPAPSSTPNAASAGHPAG